MGAQGILLPGMAGCSQRPTVSFRDRRHKGQNSLGSSAILHNASRTKVMARR
ncbi:hypothetical protein ACP4OV_021992 [Aristida adscensionis]